ncbi:YggS family pyridoxal phosphate enzyme [Bacteroidia bacterium]|nr:YggS family pyridoxal phosphate enzyme [Bacteroidia bacterium]
MAVSKNHTVAAILQAYECGQRHFGESRPQELLQKTQQLPKDIVWHFIGHLQSNKIKMVVPYVQLLHSIDNESLLQDVEKFCAKNNIHTQCLLQVHIAQEPQKFGFSLEELLQFFMQNKEQNFPHVSLQGLMGIATNTDDMAIVKNEFLLLQALQKQIQALKPTLSFAQLSLGMSHDYQVAIEAGSTLLRLGTAIFGERG